MAPKAWGKALGLLFSIFLSVTAKSLWDDDYHHHTTSSSSSSSGFSTFVSSLRGGGGGGTIRSVPFSDRFPSIEEVVEMSRLSALVYEFKDKPTDYCSNYTNEHGIHCHWYFHDTTIGTQVMIVTSSKQQYLAVVFAGTNDLQTALEDVNIMMKPFGDDSTIILPNPNIKIHAGFNNAVFSGVYTELERRLQDLKTQYPKYKLYTTGHSLGAADAILVAVALAEHMKYSVISINFGCPKTGNKEWGDYLNATSTLNSNLAIWRVVMGWDLVARLPTFFYHVGHTIQLWSANHYKYDDHEPNVTECYYRHYGDPAQGYQGVRNGWDAKPYIWIPGALSYHHVNRYVEYLEELYEKKVEWLNTFRKIGTMADDDFSEPPDDWYHMEDEVEEEDEETGNDDDMVFVEASNHLAVE